MEGLASAKRTSINRPAGTIEWKPTSVDSAEYLNIMTKPGGVLEAVREKFASYGERQIVIQHDGAPPHVGKGNGVLLDEAGQLFNQNIHFQVQPSQSPDLNKLDLCLFRSLQSRSHEFREEKNSIPDLVAAVRRTWEEYPPSALERVEALRFVVYREILRCGGDNQYDMPHTNINKRQHNGEAVIDRSVTATLQQIGRTALNNLNNNN